MNRTPRRRVARAGPEPSGPALRQESHIGQSLPPPTTQLASPRVEPSVPSLSSSLHAGRCTSQMSAHSTRVPLRDTSGSTDTLSRMVTHASRTLVLNTRARRPLPAPAPSSSSSSSSQLQRSGALHAPPRLAPLRHAASVARSADPQRSLSLLCRGSITALTPRRQALRQVERSGGNGGCGECDVSGWSLRLPLPLSSSDGSALPSRCTPELLWRRSKPLSMLLHPSSKTVLNGVMPAPTEGGGDFTMRARQNFDRLQEARRRSLPVMVPEAEALQTQSTQVAREPSRPTESAVGLPVEDGAARPCDLAPETVPADCTKLDSGVPLLPARCDESLSPAVPENRCIDDAEGSPAPSSAPFLCRLASDDDTLHHHGPRSDVSSHASTPLSLYWAHEAPSQPRYAIEKGLPALFADMVANLVFAQPPVRGRGGTDGVELWMAEWFAQRLEAQQASSRGTQTSEEAESDAQADAEHHLTTEGTQDDLANHPSHRLPLTDGATEAGAADRNDGGTASPCVRPSATASSNVLPGLLPAQASLAPSPHRYVPLTVELVHSRLASPKLSCSPHQLLTPVSPPTAAPPPSSSSPPPAVVPGVPHAHGSVVVAPSPSRHSTSADGVGNAKIGAAVTGITPPSAQPPPAKPLSSSSRPPAPLSAHSVTAKQGTAIAAASQSGSNGGNLGVLHTGVGSRAYAALGYSSSSKPPKLAAHAK